jgi:hypothetical protein
MCTTSRSPAWRPFWPRHAGASSRPVFSDALLDTGQIELQLDDHRYSVQAPLFVLTPPSVPHAFITESDSDGTC